MLRWVNTTLKHTSRCIQKVPKKFTFLREKKCLNLIILTKHSLEDLKEGKVKKGNDNITASLAWIKKINLALF